VPTDRLVRFTEDFFARLDMLLPDGRSADGTLSATDFLLFDLPPIRDRLARDYEGQTLPTDDGAVRVCISRGVLVQSVALFAQLAVDDAVEVIWLSLDLG